MRFKKRRKKTVDEEKKGYEPCGLCPVCGQYRFEESHDICPVCGWEDDRVQFTYPDYRGGANELSLNEARRRFAGRTE